MPQCGHMIEGPLVGPKGRKRPAWRRQCKRFAWSLFCWQHRAQHQGKWNGNEATPSQSNPSRVEG